MKVTLVRPGAAPFKIQVPINTSAKEVQVLLRNRIYISGNRPCKDQVLQKGDTICLLPNKR